MIFNAHLNAAYRVSLRDPGAELEGVGVQTPPARRGLSLFRQDALKCELRSTV